MPMEIEERMLRRGGLAHRREVLEAGFPVATLRAFMRRSEVEVVRRAWLVLPGAPEGLRTAVQHGGRLACVSVARRRGWWIPEHVAPRVHLHIAPGSASVSTRGHVVRHWTIPLVPTSEYAVEESIEDALAHIAGCLPRPDALVLWESAMRVERLTVDALRVVRWATTAARECALRVHGLSDSGLETILVMPLRNRGLRVQQQMLIAGRRVDALVGERLVVQVDGYEFHSSSAQRSQDIAHDAQLRLRGYTVLRFSYAQIVHDWPSVERALSRAIAAGLHLAG